MVGIYLSGTGNTKHCVEKLVSLLDCAAATLPLESEAVLGEIGRNSVILLGYPTQFSNAPYMVWDFITRNRGVWKGKKILCIATMGAFSGDGAGCTARLLSSAPSSAYCSTPSAFPSGASQIWSPALPPSTGCCWSKNGLGTPGAAYSPFASFGTQFESSQKTHRKDDMI